MSASKPVSELSEEEAIAVCESANAKLTATDGCTFGAMLDAVDEAQCEQYRDECLMDPKRAQDECASGTVLADLEACEGDVTVGEIEACFDALASLVQAASCADAGGEEPGFPACVVTLSQSCPRLFGEMMDDMGMGGGGDPGSVDAGTGGGEAGSGAGEAGTGGGEAGSGGGESGAGGIEPAQSACDRVPLDKPLSEFTAQEAADNCLCGQERTPDFDWLEFECTTGAIWRSSTADECRSTREACIARGTTCDPAEQQQAIASCMATAPEMEACAWSAVQWQAGWDCNLAGPDGEAARSMGAPACLAELCGFQSNQ